MKNKTKIELFTQTPCCEPHGSQTCCAERPCDCEPPCDCELSCHTLDTEPGKARAAELKITHLPAVAINNQPLNCGPIANAIAKTLSKQSCSCC